MATTQAPQDPLDVLQAVDWRSGRYETTCPGPGRTPVELVDGKLAPGQASFYRGLAQVAYGQIADVAGGGTRTVAAVVLSCIGAGHFPSTVLVYGVDGDDVVRELGVAVDGAVPAVDVEPQFWWEAETVSFAEGFLHVNAHGYSRQAAHCCPDYRVEGWFALSDDTPVQVRRTETFDPPARPA